MHVIRGEQRVQLAPSIRERVMELLKTLRMIADDVVNGAVGIGDEELVRWVETLHEMTMDLVHVAMH